MAVYIDPPMWPAHGRLFSHLVSDTRLDELHDVAAAVGLPRRAFDGDHYDIPEQLYQAAVAAGARPTSGTELARHLDRSGLRLRKRKGERGLARVRGVALAGGARADVDIVASGRELAGEKVFAAMAFVVDAADSFALVHSVRRNEWGSPGGRREPPEALRETVVREIHEETALTVAAPSLAVVGYERFTTKATMVAALRGEPESSRARGGANGSPGEVTQYLQVYRARVPGRRPPLRSVFDDTNGRRWVTSDEFRDLCGHLFWWPMAEHVIEREAGRAHD